jgi:thiamine pyrophosphate-dependent acetolactate synthase large subunit-like protein
MRRFDCLAALAPLVEDDLVVGNVARTSFEWHALAPREGNLYTMAMGMVTPLCLGLALALPHRRVIALDGDGSLLLNLGVLATIANQAPPNLTICVFDNESYASTGGLPTATAGVTDLAGIARTAGIKQAHTVETVGAFRALAEEALAGGGPWVIVAKVDKQTEAVAPKLMDGRENKYRFVRYVEETEKTTILKPSVVGRRDD